MASAGLLLLLLVSSSLILSSLSAPSSSNQQENLALQKRTEKKKVAFTAVQYTEKILSATVPFVSLIPVCGPLIGAIINLVSVGMSIAGKQAPDPTLALLTTEFRNLNMKIDQYHLEQKWDTWASQYQVHETNIKVAWKSFQELVNICVDPQQKKEREKHINDFLKRDKNIESSTDNLAELLTAKGSPFITNFGNLLTDHVNCHEKDIKAYIQYIDYLIYQGNTMNLFIYRSKKLDKTDKLAKTAYDVASAMFQTYTYCINNIMKYVKKDVEKLLNDGKKTEKTQLAKKIRVSLDKNFDRYNWIVVVFTTKNSKHTHKLSKSRNKHTLDGFEDVTNGELTVAVARQVKGTHTKANKVSEAIKKCVKDSDLCSDVPKKLSECAQTVDGQKLSETYSAVHAYRSKGHDSKSARDAKEAPDEAFADYQDPAAQTPYFYEGKCAKSPGVKTGKFIVLIKSDNEIEKKDPCHAKTCGGNERGKCVLLDKAIAVCECKKPYYGEDCEESLEDYKKKMNEEMPKN